ncbi:MAG: hypothetical protein ABJD66_10525 [Cellulophaga sp.]|uniref:hypothetical protein n=1 Tax=Cellulophaga sp. TaxID=1972202 RepID=UPI0032678A6B
MKKLKITLFGLLLGILTACNQVKLPNDVIEDDKAYEKLTEYIYSHYPNLKDNIEVMEFSYNSSIHPQRDEISSSLSMNLVKGSNTDRIVEYTVNNEGRLSNYIVDISVGDMMDQKLSNTYETYKPFLFSDKQINLESLRKIISKSIEEFKKETNVEKAYCTSLSVEKEANKEPEITVMISQRKFGSTIKRLTRWTIDGQKK